MNTANYISELKREIPLRGSLYSFQVEDVANCIRLKRIINGLEMGLGKTIISIASITAMDAFPCLVICPASLKLNWQEEWHRWTDKRAILLNDTNFHTWHYFADPRINIFGINTLINVFIVNFESLKKFFVTKIDSKNGSPLKLRDVRFDPRIRIFKSIVIDESSRVKDPSTQQAKFSMGICHGKEIIQLLSGIPIVNRPSDLISQLAILGRLEEFGGYSHFFRSYCEERPDLAGLQSRLKSTCYFRREKKDVLEDLPDKTRHIVPCEITDPHKQEYNDAIDDLAEYLRKYREATEAQVARSMRGEAMVRIGILKNISARGKLELICEYIRDVAETGQKIIIFTHLIEISDILEKQFPGTLTILGRDDIHARNRNISLFQEEADKKIIICSIKVASLGINLTAATNVLFAELPWHHADADQCEDRAWRNGQKNAVQCIYFLGRRTIDYYIYYHKIEKKRKVFQDITGAKDSAQVKVMDDIFEFLLQQYNEGKINELKI